MSHMTNDKWKNFPLQDKPLRSCCMTGFRRSELNANKNLYVALDFKRLTGSRHTFSKTICKQYYLIFSRTPGMLYLSSVSLSSPLQIR